MSRKGNQEIQETIENITQPNIKNKKRNDIIIQISKKFSIQTGKGKRLQKPKTTWIFKKFF